MTGSEFRIWRTNTAHLSQHTAAVLLGVSRRMLQYWEAAPDEPIPKPVGNLVRLMMVQDINCALVGGRIINIQHPRDKA